MSVTRSGFECRHVSKTYTTRNGTVQALTDVSFRVANGEFLCIVGPSGCGKSTLLKMAAAGRLPTSQLVTHTFPLERMEEAYDVFAHAAETGALKVVLGGPRREVVPVSNA